MRHAGGVLFEVMLAIALFAGAAAFTLASVQSVTRTLDRSRLQQEAVDLARSRMAELEAGVTTLGALRGEADDPIGSQRDNHDVDESAVPAAWRVHVATSRSEFTGLTLVELEVEQNLDSQAESAGVNPVRYTLRQLVALRPDDAEAWEADDLMKDAAPGGGGT